MHTGIGNKILIRHESDPMKFIDALRFNAKLSGFDEISIIHEKNQEFSVVQWTTKPTPDQKIIWSGKSDSAIAS